MYFHIRAEIVYNYAIDNRWNINILYIRNSSYHLFSLSDVYNWHLYNINKKREILKSSKELSVLYDSCIVKQNK